MTRQNSFSYYMAASKKHMKHTNRPIVIIGVLFAVFGFVTWLGSVLIPYLRIACELSNVQAYLVAFSFYISYMVMAIPSGLILRYTGYQKGMSIGLLIMAGGAALFIPASLLRSYPTFLAGLFVQGTGLALLQTAANPYVTILGPLESAAKRIGIMGICNGIAGVLAPLILGAITLKDVDSIKKTITTLSGAEKSRILDTLAHRVIGPYCIIILVLVALSLLISLAHLPEIYSDGEEADTIGEPAAGKKTSILQFPHLLLGVLALFLYVGVEVIAGDTIINYGASQGIPLGVARFFTSCTLCGMLLGYMLGIILIPKYLSQVKVLTISAFLGLLFAGIALSTHGLVSVAFIALLGLANSMIWPSIWPLSIHGLGRYTRIGSSLLIVAIGGGALLPLLYGWLTDLSTAQHAYWMLIPCYSFIAWYALRGHKAGLQEAPNKSPGLREYPVPPQVRK
jgi:glucose/galactose transporter